MNRDQLAVVLAAAALLLVILVFTPFRHTHEIPSGEFGVYGNEVERYTTPDWPRNYLLMGIVLLAAGGLFFYFKDK